MNTEQEEPKQKALLTVLTMRGIITANTFIDVKQSLEKLNRAEYQLNMEDVLGGEEGATELIVDLMNHPDSPACAITHGKGKVGSGGVYAFINGIYRTCEPKTIFHIHRHYQKMSGRISQEISPTELKFFRLIAKKSKLSCDQVIAMACAKNGYGTSLKAYEAMEMGIVHKF